MGRRLREALGASLVLGAMGVLWWGMEQLREQQFVASILLVTTGLSVLRAGVELLRPTLGE